MGKGIISMEALHVLDWFAQGKTHKDVKTLLKLPEQYQVEEIESTNGQLRITVASPDIPERFDESIPELVAVLGKTGEQDGTWDKPDSYKLTDLKVILPLPIE